MLSTPPTQLPKASFYFDRLKRLSPQLETSLIGNLTSVASLSEYSISWYASLHRDAHVVLADIAKMRWDFTYRESLLSTFQND